MKAGAGAMFLKPDPLLGQCSSSLVAMAKAIESQKKKDAKQQAQKEKREKGKADRATLLRTSVSCIGPIMFGRDIESVGHWASEAFLRVVSAGIKYMLLLFVPKK